MARYIDADALIKHIESKRLIFKDTATIATALKSQGDVIRRCIETFPTADVAPKSEVEWLEKENARLLTLSEYNRSVIEQDITDAKAEVARQVLKDVKQTGRCSDPNVVWVCLSFDELDEIEKKYTGKGNE